MSNQYSSILLCAILIFLFSGSNAARIPLTGTNWVVSNQTIEVAATVPGTVHTALLAAKVIDEPYWSFGDITMRNITYQSWTFTRNFSLESHFLHLYSFQLHFDQVDTVSNITLNQCYLGNTTSMFYAYTFNVPSSCLQLDNTLHVNFMSPVVYALEQSIAYNKSVHPECPGSAQHGECHVQFVRKEPCSFSWDWVCHIDT